MAPQSYKEVPHALRYRLPFSAGSMHGHKVGDRYIVWSYDEVIGWTDDVGALWVAESAWDWSKTTSRHANLLLEGGAEKTEVLYVP